MWRAVIATIAIVAAMPASAQSTWNFWVRGGGVLYENFFQATEGTEQEDVTALMGEAGASVELTPAAELYGLANYLHFNDHGIEGSPGVRVGLRGDARPHAYEVYAEALSNRPSFELDEFAGADIRRINGEYAFRFAEDWQVSVDGDAEEQNFDNDLRDNEYRAVGAAVRWRGSRLFSPEIGVRGGEREVNDPAQSYDQREAYVQIRSQPAPKWYLSLRLRNRTRDYQNVDREDDRRQLAFGADYSITPKLVLNLYRAREDVDSNVAGRDFDTGYWLVGLTWKF